MEQTTFYDILIKYPEILLYMLDHDEKLEQEIISWKEAL